jgi:hypothetical protein
VSAGEFCCVACGATFAAYAPAERHARSSGHGRIELAHVINVSVPLDKLVMVIEMAECAEDRDPDERRALRDLRRAVAGLAAVPPHPSGGEPLT